LDAVVDEKALDCMPKSLVYATFLHVASPPRDERSSVRLLMDWKTASACSTAVWFDLLDGPFPGMGEHRRAVSSAFALYLGF